jgi:porphobilinogen synthase
MRDLRRLRKNQTIRDLIAETELSVKDFILPYFVIGGKGIKREIKSMPGIYHLSIDKLIRDIDEAVKLGILAILLFGISKKKDKFGSFAYKENGIVQRAIRAIKKEFGDLIIITDVCLCGYTSHGHCGVIRGQRSEDRNQNKKRNLSSVFCSLPSDFIDNDQTLKILAKIALSHAKAGADFVAPSAMMDGQVRKIREILDNNGFCDVGILAYSAKYASCFYAPFREALNSAPKFGDRKSYQMDYRNSDEALREIEADIKEGADIIMIKPALAYLDIIYRAKEKFNIPIAAYNVSGEYTLVKAYCQKTEDRRQKTENRRTPAYRQAGRTEIERKLVLEILTSIKRAGADLIITYFAKEVAHWLIANS